jgi:hypothetical protein
MASAAAGGGLVKFREDVLNNLVQTGYQNNHAKPDRHAKIPKEEEIQGIIYP